MGNINVASQIPNFEWKDVESMANKKVDQTRIKESYTEEQKMLKDHSTFFRSTISEESFILSSSKNIAQNYYNQAFSISKLLEDQKDPKKSEIAKKALDNLSEKISAHQEIDKASAERNKVWMELKTYVAERKKEI